MLVIMAGMLVVAGVVVLAFFWLGRLGRLDQFLHLRQPQVLREPPGGDNSRENWQPDPAQRDAQPFLDFFRHDAVPFGTKYAKVARDVKRASGRRKRMTRR